MASYADSDRLLTVQGVITYPDTLTQAITSTHISSFNINEDAGRDVPIGAAPASYFLLKLDNSSGQWEPGGSLLGAHSLDGAKVEIEIGLWNGSAYDYSKIGTYYVEDVRGQEHETTITLSGSDAMVPKMSAYFADAPGDYPRTIGALLVDVAAEAGVTLKSSIFTNSNVFIPVQPNWRNDLTCRDVVGYIAACAGGIARFNRDGKLEITTLERIASRAISTSVYKRLTRENTTFGALNAINIYAHGAPENTAPVRFATTPATPDTSLNSINIKGNPILANGTSTISSVGTGMLTGLSGMSFRGATFDWHGDPSLVLGKICLVTDLASNSISVLITKQTIKFGAGFEMTSGCDVTTSTKADASNKLQKIFTPTGNLNAEALAGNIYVKAGEKMTLESGGNLNLLSGGEMNISSGGQLKLQSTDSIIIGGSPYSVGGTNLLKNSDFVQGSYSTWTNWANYSDATLSKHSMSIDGVKQSGNVTCPAGDTVVGISQYVNCPQPYGDNVTLSFYGYILQSILTEYGENRCVLITQYDAVGTEITSAQVSIYPSSFNFVPGENRFYRLVHSFNPHKDARTMRVLFMVYAGGTNANNMIVTNFQLEKGAMATDWSPSPQDTVDALTGIGTQISGLQTQIDGKIVSYWQTSDPSSGWTSEQKAAAVGDMWYNSTAKKLKRWNGATWDDINDQTAIDAYAKAETAKDTADGKRRVFVSQPVPPYDVGDLWAGGSSGDLKRCSTAKAVGGSYAAGDWVLATKYTDDTAYNTFVANTLPGLQARVQVFYQASKPTYTAVGDLWYDTDSNPLEVWKCTNVSTQAHSAFTDPVLTRALSAASSASSAAAAAQGTANSKITTFVQSTTPTALAAGDLWLDTGNKNIWKRATAAGTGSWMPYLTAAGYVNSTGIAIDGKDLTVKATGNLNLAADGNLNVQNGGNLNVLNGGDIEIANGGDINVASGGKIDVKTLDGITVDGGNFLTAVANNIDLSANNSIKLAVSGGENLIKNSGQFSETSGWLITQGSGNETISVESSGSLNSNILTLGNLSVDYNLRTPVSKSPIVTGQTYTLSFVFAGNKPSSAAVLDEIASTAVSPSLTFSTGEQVAGSFYLYKSTFVATAGANNIRVRISVPYSDAADYFGWIKLEKGTMATDWSPSPQDPASGVKTSYIDIATDHIDIASSGNVSIAAGANFNVRAGAGKTNIGISNNAADNYFLWAGHGTPSSAPFSVKMDGSIKAISGTIGGFSIANGALTSTNGFSIDPTQTYPQINIGNIGIVSTEKGGVIRNRYGPGATVLLLQNYDASVEIIGGNGSVWGGSVVCSVYGGAKLVTVKDNLFVTNDCSALTFTDRTPAYIGDAIAELRGVRNDKKGNIDHATLPKAARKKIKWAIKTDDTSEEVEEDGRDIGMMVSILTKAVQQLTDIVEKQQAQINQLMGVNI